MADNNEEKQPVYAECGKCAHSWPAVYIPMEVGLLCKIMDKAHCPKCGAGVKDLYLWEPGKTPETEGNE